MIEDIYSLTELIIKLEDIKKGKITDLNVPKAFLSLTYKIKEIDDWIEQHLDGHY